MATRYGYVIFQYLLSRGWIASQVEEETYGDPHVKYGNKDITPYQALEIQKAMDLKEGYKENRYPF